MKINLGIVMCSLLISTIVNAQTDTIYKTTKIAHKTWVIVENNTVNIYLAEGKDSALIIDTGYGLGDLKSYVKKITKLPLIVVNTHGHGDHVGNDHQFEKVYLSPEDNWLVNAAYSKEKKQNTILSHLKNLPVNKLNFMINVPAPNLVKVSEGHVFDLGDRKIKVIAVPGHTQGSIVLLDMDNNILFSGDNTNQLVWLFLKECLPLETYLKSLEKVQTQTRNFNIIMPGHGIPLKSNFISEQISCVKSILDGTCSSKPYIYQNISDKALICKYGTAEVAFDPENLRNTKIVENR